MTDAKLPKLAEGSRWAGVGIINKNSDSIECTSGVLQIEGDDVDGSCLAEDALAAIRVKGLDPLAIAAKELVDRLNNPQLLSILNADELLCLSKLEELL